MQTKIQKAGSVATFLTFVLMSGGCLTYYQGANSRFSTPLSNGLQYEKLTMGAGVGCAIRSDGMLGCWPGARSEEAGEGESVAEKWVAFDMGFGCACGLKEDGTIVCIGSGISEDGWSQDPKNCQPPPNVKFKQVDVGTRLHCGITVDGDAVCWGSMAMVARVEGGFERATVGGKQICFQRSDGLVACYGRDAPGCMSAPAEKLRGVTMSPWANRTAFACGINANDEIRCWGYGTWEDKDQTENPADARAKEGIELYSGEDLETMIKDQEWRARHQHTVGTGRGIILGMSQADLAGTLQDAEPLLLRGWSTDYGLEKPPAGKFRKVATGYMHACALREDGAVVCWGEDCDSGEAMCNPPPVKFKDVELGYYNACGITQDGRIACWGADVNGSCVPP